MENTWKGTTKALASKLNVEYPVAYGLIQFLASKNLATEAGTEKVPGTKGKGSTIWQIQEQININLAA